MLNTRNYLNSLKKRGKEPLARLKRKLVKDGVIKDILSGQSRKSPKNIMNTHKVPSSIETFDILFDEWAKEAIHSAGFPAEEPRQEGRIPEIVKKKIVSLWKMGLCYPDEKPASFRMADSKRSGPYQWFSYYPTTQTITPNWEYFVQIAAFHDLVVEYGYNPSWMKFEYSEPVPPGWLDVNIGIKFPDGRKAFVEVEERKDQWEVLISAIKSIGVSGVDLKALDRGKPSLRKAKNIVAGRPDFFAGYFPDGFDSFRVRYESEGRFILEPARLPGVQTLNGKLR